MGERLDEAKLKRFEAETARINAETLKLQAEEKNLHALAALNLSLANN